MGVTPPHPDRLHAQAPAAGVVFRTDQRGAAGRGSRTAVAHAALRFEAEQRIVCVGVEGHQRILGIAASPDGGRGIERPAPPGVAAECRLGSVTEGGDAADRAVAVYGGQVVVTADRLDAVAPQVNEAVQLQRVFCAFSAKPKLGRADALRCGCVDRAVVVLGLQKEVVRIGCPVLRTKVEFQIGARVQGEAGREMQIVGREGDAARSSV